MDFRKAYFDWLYEQLTKESGLLSFRYVCDAAHQIVFNESVPNDDNRAAEGQELRFEFCRIRNIQLPADRREVTAYPATLLEVLVALCRHADHMSTPSIYEWFEKMLVNLDLFRYEDDAVGPRELSRIRRVLHMMNNRTYKWNGEGSLFPLKIPTNDMRKVELWFQMAAYMTENMLY